MSGGIISRLRMSATNHPHTTVLVYPSDVIEAVDKLQNDCTRGWRMFEFAVKLLSYAEKQKRLTTNNERAYWQGTTDACRKLLSEFRGSESGYTDLFEDV